MQHDSRLQAIEHAQRIDQAAACGLHLVVCANNGSPTFISILPPLIVLDTNNNLVHDNLPKKQEHLRHALGVHGNLRPYTQLLSGHVSLSPAYRHITNSAKEVKQRADRSSTSRGKFPRKWCQKSRKMPEKPKKMFRDVLLCFMHLHAISSTPVHSPIHFMQNWENHVKVTGFSCIPIGRSCVTITAAAGFPCATREPPRPPTVQRASRSSHRG